MRSKPAPMNQESYDVYNPADGSLVGSVPAGTYDDVNNAVSIAWEAFRSWSQTDPLDRSKLLFSAAQLIRADQKDLARLLTREQGKPLRESLNEVAGFARVLEYYASISGTMHGDYGLSKNYGHMMVMRQPLGVCAAIIPWNMPVLIMGWKIGPVLATGNTMIVKPSTTAPLTCKALAGYLYRVGVPESVLQLVTGSGEVVGEALARHPDIRSLSFTGAVSTGIQVAEHAAKTFKKTILELGGSDAMIVCRDADLEAAAKGAVSGRFFNCGQTCTAIKRVFVDTKIYAPFVQRVRELAGALQVGNGLTPGVDIGPVHTKRQRDTIHSLVQETVNNQLGTVMSGGEIPDSNPYTMGSFYPPTILTDVDPDAPVMREEVFGPVLPISGFDSISDAIERANATRFGLGASVWTHDMRIISRATQELDAGIVWVNQHLRIPPEVPFGGVKSSGLGRENGRYALFHYLEEKTILIHP